LLAQSAGPVVRRCAPSSTLSPAPRYWPVVAAGHPGPLVLVIGGVVDGVVVVVVVVVVVAFVVVVAVVVTVVGAAVVGATVVGATVVGATVVGGTVAALQEVSDSSP